MTISFYFIHNNPFPRFYVKNPSEHLANKHVKPSIVLQQIQELFMASLPMELLPEACSVFLSAAALPSPSAVSLKLRTFQRCLSRYEIETTNSHYRLFWRNDKYTTKRDIRDRPRILCYRPFGNKVSCPPFSAASSQPVLIRLSPTT
jgi:hypothetical protein